MTAARLPGTELQPPSTSVGPVGWLRANLFSGWVSSAITLLLGGVMVFVSVRVLGWIIQDARWGVISSNLRLFLVGLYPTDQIWRVWLSLAVLSLLTGLSAVTWRSSPVRSLATLLAAGQLTVAVAALASGMGWVEVLTLAANAALIIVLRLLGRRAAVPRRPLVIAWLASLPLTLVLLNGLAEATPLPPVSATVWGGLLLTFMLALVGIVVSFPLGVLLAVGRRSSLPVVRILSTLYIEIVRAVPLITILFMADLLLPLFLPGDLRIDRVIRAMGGIALFSAAYVAENVRGGLQAIPLGQIEAAHALGLGTVQTNLFIVLPQALRATIPPNVGLFITLLKDTTLVVIVGLLEILGIGRAVLAQPEWLGAAFEVYVFVAAVFFVLSYTISQASYRLERELGVGER